MKNMMNHMIVKKLKSITSDELLTYSKQYNLSLTKTQAEQITKFLRSNTLDPTKEAHRLQLFKKLAQITDLPTAQKAQQLFNQLIKEYGVESLFK